MQNASETLMTGQAPGMNPNAPTFQLPTESKPCALSQLKQGVLLQTAQLVLFNPDDPQHSKQVHIVLTSGSQRSYVTERLQTELALQPKGGQSMSMVTFGARRESRANDIVNVRMKCRNGCMRDLTGFCRTTTCEALTCQPVTLC